MVEKNIETAAYYPVSSGGLDRRVIQTNIFIPYLHIFGTVSVQNFRTFTDTVLVLSSHNITFH